MEKFIIFEKIIRIKNFLRNNFLFTLTLSYFLMLLISLFLSIGIYLVSRNEIINNVIQNQIEIINNVKIIIDKELETISKLGLRIASDSNLSRLITNIENRENIFDSIITIQKMLSNYLFSDGIIENIYLYLYKPNFVLTHNNKYTFEEFKYYIKANKKLRSGDLLNLLKIRNWKNFYILKDDQNNLIFIFLQSIPDPSYREFRGVVIIEINSQKINQIMKNSIDPQKYVIGIIDKKNNYIISNENEFIKNLSFKYDFFSSKKEIFWVSQKKEKLGIIHFPSNNAEWEYFSIFSLNLILEKANHVKNISMIYLFLCLIFGILIAIILGRRSYNPIKKLIEKVSEKVKVNENLSDNEIKFLDRIFENMIEQNRKLEIELQEKKSKLIENLLIRLLKENVNYNKSIYKYTEDLKNIDLHSSIILIGVSINKIEDKIFKIEENEEEIDIIYSVVTNAVGDIINSKYRYFPLNVDGKILFIISDLNGSSLNIDNLKKYLNTTFNYIADLLIKSFGIYTSFAISRVYSSLYELSSAYEDINAVFEYFEFSKTNNKIIFFDEINKKDNSTINEEIFISLKRILECIIINDYKNIFEYNNELISKIQEYSQMNPQISKFWIYTYKNLILNTLVKLNSHIDKCDFVDFWNHIQKTNDINTLKDLYENILKISIDIYENNEIKKPYWIDSIIEYIKNNYNSYQLCVNTISDKFGISSEHLSRTFKRFVGINLSDFIHMIRLEKAKKLLEESNLTIKEIAEKTGYIDSKALIRAFKNYIGITPSKYREKNYRGNKN